MTTTKNNMHVNCFGIGIGNEITIGNSDEEEKKIGSLLLVFHWHYNIFECFDNWHNIFCFTGDGDWFCVLLQTFSTRRQSVGRLQFIFVQNVIDWNFLQSTWNRRVSHRVLYSSHTTFNEQQQNMLNVAHRTSSCIGNDERTMRHNKRSTTVIKAKGQGKMWNLRREYVIGLWLQLNQQRKKSYHK